MLIQQIPSQHECIIQLCSAYVDRSVLLARAATAGHLWLSAPLLGLRHERHVLAVRVFASRAVVVVESPTKAKKIQGFLGDDYQVRAAIVTPVSAE